MNIFEQATRKKLRFASDRGQLSVEQVWDLPPVSKVDTALTLDKLARSAYQELKNFAEESFVAVPKENPQRELADLRFKVVKHIIDVKLLEESEKKMAAARRQEKEKIMEALERREQADLQNMSRDELLAKLRSL